MSIELKVAADSLKHEIAKMIAEQDALAQKAANQILIEGKNAAHALSLKDTNHMDNGIERVSKVERISPCIYSITLGSDADYTEHQEFGPKEETKRKWRFRPFIRPSVFIMQAKARECIERVYGEG